MLKIHWLKIDKITIAQKSSSWKILSQYCWKKNTKKDLTAYGKVRQNTTNNNLSFILNTNLRDWLQKFIWNNWVRWNVWNTVLTLVEIANERCSLCRKGLKFGPNTDIILHRCQRIIDVCQSAKELFISFQLESEDPNM